MLLGDVQRYTDRSRQARSWAEFALGESVEGHRIYGANLCLAGFDNYSKLNNHPISGVALPSIIDTAVREAVRVDAE